MGQVRAILRDHKPSRTVLDGILGAVGNQAAGHGGITHGTIHGGITHGTIHGITHGTIHGDIIQDLVEDGNQAAGGIN